MKGDSPAAVPASLYPVTLLSDTLAMDSLIRFCLFSTAAHGGTAITTIVEEPMSYRRLEHVPSAWIPVCDLIIEPDSAIP
ncbi:hypothetical protein [Nocardia sp. R6R-6]|uniref:hypothetical protein n=1 Tax=Nocardia sp. R6R-6 TaxID=3459303 RepID=UPI00403D75B6